MKLMIDVPELTETQLAEIKAANNKTITWEGNSPLGRWPGGDQYRSAASTSFGSAKITRMEKFTGLVPASFMGN
jgi:hypothetical protein